MMNTDSGQARRQLEQILAEPEFGRQIEMDQLASRNWMGEILQGSGQFSTIVEWLVYILIGIVIVALIGGLVFYWWRGQKHRLSADLNVEKVNPQTALLAEIKELANKEDYESAMQKCFLLLLQKLAKQENLHFPKTKTNGEFRSMLIKIKPIIAEEFGVLSKQFDQVWYGEQKIEAEDYYPYQRRVFAFLGQSEEETR